MNDGALPAHLRDADDYDGVPPSDIGWFIVGIFITGALACPLVLARHRVVDMRSSWMSSGGTWCAVLALSIGALLLIKGQQQRDGF